MEVIVIIEGEEREWIVEDKIEKGEWIGRVELRGWKNKVIVMVLGKYGLVEIVLEGGEVDMKEGNGRKLRIRRGLKEDIEKNEMRDEKLEKIGKNGMEKIEGLGIVLVKRVEMGIEEEEKEREKMVEIEEMIEKEIIERMNDKGIIEIGNDMREEELGILGRRIVGGLIDEVLKLLLRNELLI